MCAAGVVWSGRSRPLPRNPGARCRSKSAEATVEERRFSAAKGRSIIWASAPVYPVAAVSEVGTHVLTTILLSFSPSRSSAISTSRSRWNRGNFSPHSISRMLLLSERRSSSASVSSSRCVSMR
jgi:hypothetical protein